MGCGATDGLRRLQRKFEGIQSLSIDEISTVGASLFAVLLDKAKLLKMVEPGTSDSEQLINMYFSGDLHQKLQPGSATIYGDQLTRSHAAAAKTERHVIDRINRGRVVWSTAVDPVVILEDDNRSMDAMLQRFQQKLRHVSKLCQRDLDDIEEACLLQNRTDRKEDMTAFADDVIVAGARWASLDLYAEKLLRPSAQRVALRRRLVVKAQDRRQTKSSVRWEQCPPVAPFVAEILDLERTVYTQRKTGEIHRSLHLVFGLDYVVWGSQSAIDWVGGAKGVTGTLVGAVLSATDRLRWTKADLADPNAPPLELEDVPEVLFLKLHDDRMLKGQRIGSLPMGVVPLYPKNVKFVVNPAKTNKVWWENELLETVRATNSECTDEIVVWRRGFQLKYNMIMTDFGESLANPPAR